ncbi:hypothetical protein SAMN05444679_10670 [Variovorax sp. CF079]|uniref:hypothetical protein n=1 Tax=Variovorax sp. CF079 TaxID=1882774 RepID=UPI0008864C43|nr:hypothetical protein [Variovorax sp. CF079]SDC90869.1 hypothetical protein SAMN05444679_10670 [Variovorax sp. CF079]
MDATNTQAWLALGIVVILVLAALAAYFSYRRRQSRRLADRFGSEYGHAVEELGSRSKAEAELRRREARVEALDLVALAPGEAARFSRDWKRLQAEFVDNPAGVVGQADQPVHGQRGIATDDLQQPAAEKQAPAGSSDESLDPLFSPDVARDFRASWDAVQIGFVDDPQQAVRKADELVRQVLDNLSQTFSKQRGALEGQTDQVERASTEQLRMALRRYRAFLQRLLSL